MTRFAALLSDVRACNLWLERNPWFAAELVPALRQRVAEVLS